MSVETPLTFLECKTRQDILWTGWHTVLNIIDCKTRYIYYWRSVKINKEKINLYEK
jgi:hypothetical protein